jgi:hypothetical protein
MLEKLRFKVYAKSKYVFNISCRKSDGGVAKESVLREVLEENISVSEVCNSLHHIQVPIKGHVV